jgi:hypothetical protein
MTLKTLTLQTFIVNGNLTRKIFVFNNRRKKSMSALWMISSAAYYNKEIPS